jgi:hypothetical protein
MEPSALYTWFSKVYHFSFGLRALAGGFHVTRGVRAESVRVVGTADTNTSFSQWLVFSIAGAIHSGTGDPVTQEDFFPEVTSLFLGSS